MLGFVTVLGIWAAAGALLAWGALPARWRLVLSVSLSLTGLVFLVLATSTEGFRETQATTKFLVGPPQVTDLASASASLPYYVLTAVCLLLGSLGVVASDALAQSLARRFLLWAVALSVLVIAVRFLLEKAAAPASWVLPFGVFWLPPVVGAWFYYHLGLRKEAGRLVKLAGLLLAYGVMVRAVVVLFYLVATRLHLGSHYDLSSLRWIQSPWGTAYSFEPGSMRQILFLAVVPQFLVWPLFTVLSGLLGAAMVWAISRAAYGRR